MITIQKHLSSNTLFPATGLSEPEFGKQISDHMFLADYDAGSWSGFRIVPYGKMEFYPSMLALHYGQSVFEGLKAFRMHDGRISVFRPDSHAARFNRSLERMCMPPVPAEVFMDGLRELVSTDRQWVPAAGGSSLYLRPFCFATEPRLRMRVSGQYQFIILTSPAGKYFGKPYRLKVETYYTRTAEGGTGFAKCAGNYGGSYYPVTQANSKGYDQVLWTDAREHKYIDEAGMMNIMFIIDGKLVTPSLNSAILDGITRDSVIRLAIDSGMTVEERRISVDELEDHLVHHRVSEVFGTGTAAVVAPVAVIGIGSTDYPIPDPSSEAFQNRIAEKLQRIRTGMDPDPYGWNYIIA